VEKIIAKKIEEFSAQLKSARQISLSANAPALRELAKQSYSDDFGARQVEKVIQDTVQELVISVLREKKHKINYELVKEKETFKLV